MHLIEILLPLADNEGRAFPREVYRQVSNELAERFGGLTTHMQAPAEGLWRDEGERTTRDEIVIFEVMADELDTAWWRGYRRELEARFRQDAIVIRAQLIMRL